MLGLKREIIKERDAVGDMWEEGTKEIWVGHTGGDADRCRCVSTLFYTGAEVYLLRFPPPTTSKSELAMFFSRNNVIQDTFKLEVKLKLHMTVKSLQL